MRRRRDSASSTYHVADSASQYAAWTGSLPRSYDIDVNTILSSTTGTWLKFGHEEQIEGSKEDEEESVRNTTMSQRIVRVGEMKENLNSR